MRTHVFCSFTILALLVAALTLTVELQNERQINAMLRDRHPVGFTKDALTDSEMRYCAEREKASPAGEVKFSNGHECSWGVGWSQSSNTGSAVAAGDCGVASTGSMSNVSITCGESAKKSGGHK